MTLLQDAPPQEEWRVATAEIQVHRWADAHTSLRGQIARGGVFRVFGRVEGEDCEGGWAQVDAYGYACLTRSEAADGPVVMGDLPYRYGHRTARAPGDVYASRAAWDRGDRPIGPIPPDTSWKFVAIEETEKGSVLVRPDGKVLPLATTALYTPSTFVGRDLVAEPIPEGRTLAWCVQLKGCPTDGEAIPFQGSFLVEDVKLQGRPWLRYWRDVPMPAGVGADEVWASVSLSQQTLTLHRGVTPIFATLISGGRGGIWRTPTGTFHVLDKMAWNDMTSRAEADEPYAVDAVPWVVHVWPRIALHGTYWHDRFGRPMSHGCVNLSPADARRVFEALGPPLPEGWRVIWPIAEDSGSVVRIGW